MIIFEGKACKWCLEGPEILPAAQCQSLRIRIPDCSGGPCVAGVEPESTACSACSLTLYCHSSLHCENINHATISFENVFVINTYT